MAEISLYIATSLDGYIADARGGVGWLNAYDDEEQGEDYGYADFYSSVSALAMGRRTYDQVLGFGEWPYPGKPTYVFTNTPLISPPPQVEAIQSDAAGFTRTIAAQCTGRVWLVGGADLAQQFHAHGLIDEYLLFVAPLVLGDGIRLFRRPAPPASMRLVESRSYDNGFVQLAYRPQPVVHPDP